MSGRFAIVDVESTGTTTTRAFVTRAGGCGLETVTMPVYPPSPRGRAFREARLADPYRTLGQAARALGLSAADVSGLETGRKVFRDVDDWQRAILAMKASS